MLLAIFGLLVIAGIKDSAKVALGIFSLHVLTLVGFLILGAVYALKGGHSFLPANLHGTSTLISNGHGLIVTLVLGFSASLLGVSGFESSANFVEEQRKGTFRKTLRNMLIGVTVFNPLIALVVLNVMGLHAIAASDTFYWPTPPKPSGATFLASL